MKDPFAPLDDYEKELMEYTEGSDFIPVSDEKERIAYFSGIARSTMRKDQRMNIRISEKDIMGLKALALQEGIPYQTLASSILHKYVEKNLNRI